MSRAVRYTLFVAGLTALVGLAGGALAGGGRADDVWVGALVGGLVQVALFWATLARMPAERVWTAYGLGMLGRFAVFGLFALLLVPRLGLALAPTLFALVAVFWLATLVEPLHFKPRTEEIG